jgi:hypothetical protein
MNLPKFEKTELLYDASEDGWQIKKFHEKCKDKPRTLIIIKAVVADEKGNQLVRVFGGYNDRSWNT